MKHHARLCFGYNVTVFITDWEVMVCLVGQGETFSWRDTTDVRIEMDEQTWYY